MKISKKTIVIIIIVAVVAYVLWKRRKGAGGLEEVDVSVVGASSGLDPHNLEDCMTAAFGNDQYASVFRQQVMRVASDANRMQAYKDQIMARAAENGFTYEQQLVLQGSYQECYRKDENGQWVPKDSAHKAYHTKVKERLAAM